MGLPKIPEMEIPQPYWPSQDFVDNIGEQAEMLRAQLKEDEDFVGEYFHGDELITIANIRKAGRDTVKLVGYDKHERLCHIFANVASLVIVFRMIKKESNSQRRPCGFVADSTNR